MPGPVNPLAPGVQVTNNGLEIADGTNVRATLGKLPDGTYGLLIYNGAIELIDQFGQTIMSNGAFTGPMIDYIQSGVYNNMFVAGTPGVLPIGSSRDDAAGHTVNCPGWTVWRSSGAATATMAVSAAYPGGQYVEFDFAAVGTSTTNNVALTTDLFPLVRGMQVTPGTVESVNVPASVTLNFSYSLLCYTAAGAYISTVSSVTSAFGAISWAPTLYEPGVFPSVPVNARFGRFEITLWETTAHSAATYDRFGGVALTREWPLMTFTQGLVSGGATTINGPLLANGPVILARNNGTDGIGFFGVSGSLKQTVTGSRGGNAALAALLTALANHGLIVDGSGP
jgi:hypothetical protein